jgi:cellulose synthase/poly-beta-1,6-N-acetylglucosamine synthase-like glycosyltransferase
MMPKISVVIPAYNAANTLAQCLAALRRQVDVPGPFEVIVVDDGSDDATAEVARGFGVTLLQQSHAGPAAARNRGIQAARGELVFFTDADCIPADDWLTAMAQPFAAWPQVVGCKGVYATRQREFIARFAQAEYEMRYQTLAAHETIDFVDAYSAGYRRSVLLAAGGFDTSFTSAAAEDTELAFRLSAQGHRLVFNPDAIVWHRHSPTLLSYLRRKARYSFWQARVYARHPSKMRGDSHTPPALWWQLPLSSVGTLAGMLSLFWKPATWLLAGCLALFVLTCLSFVRQSARQGPLLALATPILLWLRALTMVGGLLAGMLCLIPDWLVPGAVTPEPAEEPRR